MITAHDVAVFIVSEPIIRKKGIAWSIVEKSDTFVLIQAMIQAAIDAAVTADRQARE